MYTFRMCVCYIVSVQPNRFRGVVRDCDRRDRSGQLNRRCVSIEYIYICMLWGLKEIAIDKTYIYLIQSGIILSRSN